MKYKQIRDKHRNNEWGDLRSILSAQLISQLEDEFRFDLWDRAWSPLLYENTFLLRNILRKL